MGPELGDGDPEGGLGIGELDDDRVFCPAAVPAGWAHCPNAFLADFQAREEDIPFRDTADETGLEAEAADQPDPGGAGRQPRRTHLAHGRHPVVQFRESHCRAGILILRRRLCDPRVRRDLFLQRILDLSCPSSC